MQILQQKGHKLKVHLNDSLGGETMINIKICDLMLLTIELWTDMEHGKQSLLTSETERSLEDKDTEEIKNC
ncbi:8523_t:CDS:2 [Entrophospora sp. SA101]|nr:8523_t:CDS:2 [Entrophospora sp. SA101]